MNKIIEGSADDYMSISRNGWVRWFKYLFGHELQFTSFFCSVRRNALMAMAEGRHLSYTSTDRLKKLSNLFLL